MKRQVLLWGTLERGHSLLHRGQEGERPRARLAAVLEAVVAIRSRAVTLKLACPPKHGLTGTTRELLEMHTQAHQTG